MLALIKPKFQPTFNSIAKNDCRIIKLQFKEKFIKRCGSFDCSFSCSQAVFKWSDDGTAVASHRPEHQRLFPMHFQSWWGKGRGSCNFGTAATAVCDALLSWREEQLQLHPGNSWLQFDLQFKGGVEKGRSSCSCSSSGLLLQLHLACSCNKKLLLCSEADVTILSALALQHLFKNSSPEKVLWFACKQRIRHGREPKGSCQKRFSRFFPLRKRNVTENHFAKKP